MNFKILVISPKSAVPFDIDSILPTKMTNNIQSNGEILSNRELVRARETLQQYLQVF